MESRTRRRLKVASLGVAILATATAAPLAIFFAWAAIGMAVDTGDPVDYGVPALLAAGSIWGAWFNHLRGRYGAALVCSAVPFMIGAGLVWLVFHMPMFW